VISQAFFILEEIFGIVLRTLKTRQNFDGVGVGGWPVNPSTNVRGHRFHLISQHNLSAHHTNVKAKVKAHVKAIIIIAALLYNGRL
jgi:hypothetical protein